MEDTFQRFLAARLLLDGRPASRPEGSWCEYPKWPLYVTLGRKLWKCIGW
jgi:hypothetical protein